MYDVAVDWSPAYELLVSLWAYTARTERKTLELGPSWVEAVRQRLDAAGQAQIEAGEALVRTGLADLLVHLCPRKETVSDFLDWLADLAPGDLYELVTPFLLDEHLAQLRDLAGWRDGTLALLRAWDEQYYRALDPAIQAGLAANAAATRALFGAVPPPDLVERATAGVRLEPTPGLATVLLVPQYHFRPWNLNEKHRGLRIILYPADAVATPPGEPSPALLRLTRALADENRLRILRFLSPTPRGFTEVVTATGLAKSTVHYHLVALRAAGLVRVHEVGESATSYSVRVDALDEVRDRLGAFLAGADGTN